jgi:hypothetical protein
MYIYIELDCWRVVCGSYLGHLSLPLDFFPALTDAMIVFLSVVSRCFVELTHYQLILSRCPICA